MHDLSFSILIYPWCLHAAMDMVEKESVQQHMSGGQWRHVSCNRLRRSWWSHSHLMHWYCRWAVILPSLNPSTRMKAQWWQWQLEPRALSPPKLEGNTTTTNFKCEVAIRRGKHATTSMDSGLQPVQWRYSDQRLRGSACSSAPYLSSPVRVHDGRLYGA